MDLITHGVYVGDWEDGHSPEEFPKTRLCVLEQRPKRSDTQWIPILGEPNETGVRARPEQLDICALFIESTVVMGRPILVHCGAGIERSPLTVAWWLVKTQRVPSFDDAYALLTRRRSIVGNRMHWLQGARPTIGF